MKIHFLSGSTAMLWSKNYYFFIVFVIKKSQAIVSFKAGYLITLLEHSPSTQPWHVELISLYIGILSTKMT